MPNPNGRPKGAKNNLTKQLASWFEKDMKGVTKDLQHPVFRLLLIGNGAIDEEKLVYNTDTQRTELITEPVPSAVQVKALSEALKYIMSPSAARLELTGADGEPLNPQLTITPEELLAQLVAMGKTIEDVPVIESIAQDVSLNA